jgi:hypothetical protein
MLGATTARTKYRSATTTQNIGTSCQIETRASVVEPLVIARRSQGAQFAPHNLSGGTIENAQAMAAHETPRTTKL